MEYSPGEIVEYRHDDKSDWVVCRFRGVLEGDFAENMIVVTKYGPYPVSSQNIRKMGAT